jgi:hypothetical protein
MIMFNANDPIGKMGEILGTLFAIMADEVIKNCGKEDGEKIVRDAAWRFGFYRGQRMKERVLADGKELTLENYEKYSDLPENNAWDATSECTETRLRECTNYCPYAKAWKELGLEDVGSLYCIQDEAMIRGYMEDVEFIRPKLFNDNEESQCEMIIIKK